MTEKSNGILLPYLYKEDDAIGYWKDCYEMSTDQLNFMTEIYKKRIHTSEPLFFDSIMKEKLYNWFSGEIDECIESFKEMNIYFE